jgi:hypothetical protein
METRSGLQKELAFMLTLSLRPGRSPSYRPPFGLRAHLRLECLEDRVVANAAPSISSFSLICHLPNRQVVVSGQVESDNGVDGLTVTFSGAASGQTQTDADGYFQATLTCSQLGQIQATAVDADGVGSAVAAVTVTNSAPSITNFNGSEGPGHLWTFTGRVVDEAPAGLTVVFTSGMPSLHQASCTVQADGSFSYSVLLCDPNDHGTVEAKVTDWWGAQSESVFWLVEPSGLATPTFFGATSSPICLPN